MTRPDSSRAIAPTTFRGDVQGLRAIAVLTVIAGHAGVTFLPGGFVGVDVFFVISGFLISHLLFREVDRNGKVSLRDFYARRARRILPAATVVTLATLGASIFWISVVDSLEVVKDALWATFFAANVRFSSVGTDYFAQEDGPSPLQHYWSLAVEEQFYLVWPLILIACILLARRLRTPGGRRLARGSDLPRLTVFWVLLAVGVTSFVYGLILTANNPTAAYFSTPARAWELAIGALAALVARAVAAKLDTVARGLLCLMGLGAIAYACFAFDETTPMPGWAAAVPVLGSAAVLLAGAGGHEREPLPIRALGVKPMRIIGDWSFSLYLWHWPLLVLPELRNGDQLSPGQSVLAVALTFVFAALTYRFVETPFRSPKRVTRTKALALYPVSIALVALSSGAGQVYAESTIGGEGPAITIANSGIRDTDITVSKNETIALVQASVVAARNNHEIPRDLSPSLLDVADDIADVEACEYNTSGLRDLCPRGDTEADKSIAVLGNSHGRMWIPAIERIAEREGYTTYYFVKPNCTGAMLDIADLQGSTPPAPWEDCVDFRDWAIEQIAEIHPDITIVATSGPNPIFFSDDGEKISQESADRVALTQQGFADTFTTLKPFTDRVVLLRDIPKSEEEPSTCLTSADADLGTCLFTPIEPQEVDSDASMRAAEETDTEYIDPTPWICWDGECPVVIGDLLPYRDRGHLSTVYAAELGDDLGRALGIWND